MRRPLGLIIASIVSIAGFGSATAADLGAATPYTKAPPPVLPPIYDWSGFYIGINGGGGSSHNCWELVTDFMGGFGDEGCHNATGGTIGGQIGYRWQSANWVFGIEGQGNWADFKGSNVSLLDFDFFNRSRIDAFGLLTGQAGYAWNNVLFYVKGGAAVTGNKYDVFDAGLLDASADSTRWGATVGAGLDVGFAPNWSVGFEYDHLFMGTRNINFTDATVERIRQDVDIGLVRLNYHFGGWGVPYGGPVTTPY